MYLSSIPPRNISYEYIRHYIEMSLILNVATLTDMKNVFSSEESKIYLKALKMTFLAVYL